MDEKLNVAPFNFQQRETWKNSFLIWTGYMQKWKHYIDIIEKLSRLDVLYVKMGNTV